MDFNTLDTGSPEFGGKTRREATAEAFESPRAGDVFSEMCSFWVRVLEVLPSCIVVLEHIGPFNSRTPEDRDQTLKVFSTVEDFRKKYSYGSIQGYWVSLMWRGQDVSYYTREWSMRVLAGKEARV